MWTLVARLSFIRFKFLSMSDTKPLENKHMPNMRMNVQVNSWDITSTLPAWIMTHNKYPDGVLQSNRYLKKCKKILKYKIASTQNQDKFDYVAG